MLSCGRLDRANSKTMIEQAIERLWVLGPTALVALVLSFGLMLLLRPWLERYAMVQPNARSSHDQPTPQGGGIAVVIATLVVVWGAVASSPALLHNQAGQFLAVTAATALLAVVGAIDDVRSLPAAARRALQPAGGAGFSWRCGQPADWASARLALGAACRNGSSGGGVHPTPLLSRRHDDHPHLPPRAGRGVLASSSDAFLSARHRLWVDG